MEPVKSVYDNYIKLQAALASDSIKGIPEAATAIAKAVRSDSMKMLPAKVADQADNVAKANNIKAAREEFKPLSDSLINYLRESKASGTGLNEVFCPMAKASWLQKEKDVNNPYMGKSMPSCGSIKRAF